MRAGSLLNLIGGRAAASVILAAAMFLFSSCSFNNAAVQTPPALPRASAIDEADLTAAALAAPGDYLKNALNLKADGKDMAAKLLALRSGFHDTPWALRASFLLGTIALEKSDLAGAEKYFYEAFDLKDVRDYVLFSLARTKRMQGQTREAVDACDLILRLYPGSPLRTETLYEKAAALSEGGDLNGALKAVSELVGARPGNPLRGFSPLAPDALLKYAQWSWRLGRPKDALDAIRRIRINYPADNAATGADRLLADIKNAGSPAPQLAAEDIMIRAQRLFAAGRYKDAAREFSSVFNISSGKARCRPASLLGQAQIRLKRYAAAQKSLLMFLDEKTGCDNEADALYWLGLADLRLGRLEELARVEKRLASKFPESVARARVLTLLADFYEDNNDKRGALRICRHIINKWPDSPASEQAYWKAGWIEYSMGSYLTAYKDFATYASLAPGGKDVSRFLYWSGRAAEKAGRTDEAASAYVRVCSDDAGSFYCLLAQARPALIDLHALQDENAANPRFSLPSNVLIGGHARAGASAAKPPEGVQPLEGAKPPDVSGRNPASEDYLENLLTGSRYPVVAELLTIGMNSRAASEIELLMETYKDDAPAMNALAGLYAATGEYGRALEAWKKYFKKPSYTPTLPSPVEGEEIRNGASHDQAMPDIAFPTGIVESVKKAATDGGVDPYLVAAVMREESCFNQGAVSSAGAMGLLQVMPKTGSFAAKKLGIKDFKRISLFKPGVNIRIGAWYLGYLALRFNNDLVLTVAGYNAGPNATAKWIKTLPRETDEFIEAIPYRETRHYVMRVISSYAQYLRLSGIDPNGLLLRPMITNEVGEANMAKPVAMPVDPKWRVEESALETKPAM